MTVRSRFFLFFFLLLRRLPISTLFPYTTLFRSLPALRQAPLHLARASRPAPPRVGGHGLRSEEHTSELQSPVHIVYRLLLEKKNWYGISIPRIELRQPLRFQTFACGD